MDLRLTPSQLAFRDEVRAFIAARLPATMRERLRRGMRARMEDMAAWHQVLNERGWVAPHWPPEYGGAGLGIAERVILTDELYRACAPQPLITNIGMLGTVLLRYGTAAQKSYFLPKLLSMETIFCQGFSEPNAGSDLTSLKTRAVREGGHYVVDGQKIWTSHAHDANWMFALVRTGQGERKQDGISFLLIDLRSPGVSVRPIRTIDGYRTVNEVFFEGTRVPAENLVGEEGRGWDCARYLLNSERSSVANVGLCWERLSCARELAATVRQGKRYLIDDPSLRAELARLGAEIRALELTNWRFLLDPDIARTNPGFASVLKLKGSETMQALTRLIARIAGPAGLERHDLDTAVPDTMGAALWGYFFYRAATIFGGSSEVQKDILAKATLG
ncbi:acyl-CoA dehydrogenase family protein [Cupriavidus oxalaticus]|uniref:Acyl-CoA dehydrogenase n=1 Tax=Cupriavidus oxalaticus TaxID=96344 RepID=A0A5P3V993_9BURK|nr:acyl-CoA dehydrogenase family protein [Cupriavidus oxalaticus]QEZ42917.1 acyl-CoA dehydrogenase [Cupriavidus oxalaticus]